MTDFVQPGVLYAGAEGAEYGELVRGQSVSVVVSESGRSTSFLSLASVGRSTGCCPWRGPGSSTSKGGRVSAARCRRRTAPTTVSKKFFCSDIFCCSFTAPTTAQEHQRCVPLAGAVLPHHRCGAPARVAADRLTCDRTTDELVSGDEHGVLGQARGLVLGDCEGAQVRCGGPPQCKPEHRLCAADAWHDGVSASAVVVVDFDFDFESSVACTVLYGVEYLIVVAVRVSPTERLWSWPYK